MSWRFRRSKTLGPFRLTLSKRGLGVSAGVGRARMGIGADGKVRESLRVAPGLWWQQTLGRSSRSDDATPARGPRGVLLFAMVVVALFAAYWLWGRP